MSAVKPIKIEGLKEFQRALKATEDGLQKELRVGLNKAAQLVVDVAQPRFPRRTGRAQASIKAQSSQREAKIVGGSKKVPYVGWLEFGGRIGKDKSVKRPFVKGGRYIFPALGSHRDEVIDAISGAVVDLARRSGMEVDDGR